MRLLALVKNLDHVCCRYRFAAMRPHFARAGHQLHLRPWPKSWLGRWVLRRELRQFDAVIIQRRLLSRLELPLIRGAAKRLIFDFDDAVYLRDSFAKAGFDSMTRLNGFIRTVLACDLVVAGNDILAKRAAGIVGADKVHVVPTCVDPQRYPMAEHHRSGSGVRLAWIGSSSTLRGLERNVSLWEEIGRHCPGVALRLICDKSLALTHLPVEFRPWAEATEAADLAGADMGISWMPDDDWSNGKCGLKVLQYMAAGLPVIANLVGVQVEMVRHCETGFLVETPDQWCDAVARLAGDPALRRQMGEAGRRVVREQFSVHAGAARWLAALDKWTPSPARMEVAV